MGFDGISKIGSGISEPQSASLQPLNPSQQDNPRFRNPLATPPYVVNLSSEGKALSANNKGGGSSATTATDSIGVSNPGECQTCNNRRYVDRSSDSSVSFQTPTRVAPGAAEGAVRAHEQEHVNNEQAKAKEQGARVVFQSVSIQYSICPECGTSYVAGGTTTTVTKAKQEPAPAAAGSSAGSASRRGVDIRF